MKTTISSKKREILLFIERILACVLAVCMVFIFMNSFFNISTSYGTTYHYGLSFLEQEKAFEDREIFQALLKGNVEQITRYVVICDQLETNGNYDPYKKIDIMEYANRMEEGAPNKSNAIYYLDDLINWGNYGFSYHTETGIWEESGESYSMETIVSRYKTVDGKTLIQCASSAEEYNALKESLVSSAKSLASNYTEYIDMEQRYGKGKTNIGYCFQIPNQERFVYYSNSDLIFQGKNTDDITAMIKELGGKFIYFNPDKVQINTNTELTAKQMRSLLKEYGYAFGDHTRVWIWVDTTYPVADSLYLVREELNGFRPYFLGLTAASVGAAIGILLLLLYLTVKEGRIIEEGSIRYDITKQDRFVLEIAAVASVLAEAMLLGMMGWCFMAYRRETIGYSVLPILIGILMFAANEVAIRFYFSLVRRMKAKKIWETTLLYQIGKRGRAWIADTWEHGGVLTRTWIPYLIFLMVNLILVLLGIGGVIGAFLLDMLIGIYVFKERKAKEEIIEGMERIKNGESKYRIDTTHLHGDNLTLANSVNTIGEGIHRAVENSLKDEKLKTDLITNVSHDIKTPLTSIITYVDLLKREQIENERVAGYLDILDNKSQRLKQLIDDLVEVSKISSGNISIQRENINFVELVRQAIGEFDEKFEEKNLQVVTKLPEIPMMIEADSSQLWRVMENLFTNISKYALNGTRVYVEMEEITEGADVQYVFSAKNISANYLKVNPDDLTERFIRGDEARQTEGSGLGLSIAKNLIEVQGGELEIQVDGDLFKAIIRFHKKR